MMQRTTTGRAGAGRASTWEQAAPEVAARSAGALLALAVAAVHVADQGGVTTLATPDWIGWGFRLTEAGGVLTAITLLLPWPAWLGWAAALLLGLGPFTGYIATRAAALPGDQGDAGNWGNWIGTVSLVIEAALAMLSIAMLLAHRQRSRAGGRGHDGDVDPRRRPDRRAVPRSERSRRWLLRDRDARFGRRLGDRSA
jgi:hypothetical protein